DPERGAAGAAPIELARRARRAVQTIGAADGEAKPEAVSGRQEMSRLDVAEMVGRHVTHDRTREQSLAVQLSTVREHLRKSRVVQRRAGGAGATGVVLLRRGDVEKRDGLAGRPIGLERLGEALRLP